MICRTCGEEYDRWNTFGGLMETMCMPCYWECFEIPEGDWEETAGARCDVAGHDWQPVDAPAGAERQECIGCGKIRSRYVGNGLLRDPKVDWRGGIPEGLGNGRRRGDHDHYQ